MKGAIASTDWNACETCTHEGVCDEQGNSYFLHRLGDWIICDGYEEREDSEDD